MKNHFKYFAAFCFDRGLYVVDIMRGYCDKKCDSCGKCRNTSIIKTLPLDKVDFFEEYIINHQFRVAELCLKMADFLGLSRDKTGLLVQCALLHDIGKFFISEYLLMKKGPLTEEEYEDVKNMWSSGLLIIVKEKGGCLAMFKIGLDLGYGYVKGVNEAGKGVVFPSLVSGAYDRPLSALFGGQRENIINNMHIILTNGNKEEYFVGELARREGRNVSYAFDEDKINHPSTKALLAAASMILFPEEDMPVHLVTGLPLEQFVNQKAEFEDMLKNFKIIASFKGDQKVKIIKFARVTVFPQAAGAVYGAILDDISKYLVPGSYIGLIDVGFRTTDFIAFVSEDKLVLREDLSGTINIGMAAVNNAADKLFTQKTGSKLDIPELMRLINTGKIFYKGRELDFAPELADVKTEISRVIKDRIKTAWGSKMDFFNAVFLAGGGAKELQSGLSDIYEKTVLVEDPQFANARGFLKVASIEERKVAAS